MTAPSVDELFSVIAHASCGEHGFRVELSADADLQDPMTRLGVALNVLLDDLDYRSNQAEEAVRRREEFISVAGHELRTPLMSLQLMLEGMRRGMIGGSPDQLQKVVELAERQGRKLAMLVDALLGVGRARSGQQLRLETASVDLVALAREVVELMSGDSAKAHCGVVVEATGPVNGRWDRQRLTQVLMNVLANAIKFGRGHPIEVAIHESSGIARVAVRDHGIGMTPDQLERAFELFERGVSSSHYGGLGIGLFVVREIVEAHGGDVRADSTPGKGATIIIELPTAGPPETDHGADS